MAKVVLKLPAKGIEADYEVKTNPDGSAEVHIEPFFYGLDSQAAVAYLTTLNDDEDEVCKMALQISGSKGNYKLSDFTKKVTPRFGKAKAKTATKPAAAEKTEGAK